MWLHYMIDSWISSIHAEYLFLLEVVVIDDQLTYLKVELLYNTSRLINRFFNYNNANIRFSYIARFLDYIKL